MCNSCEVRIEMKTLRRKKQSLPNKSRNNDDQQTENRETVEKTHIKHILKDIFNQFSISS